MLVWKINDWEMVRNCCLFIQSEEWESSRSEGNEAWRLVTTKWFYPQLLLQQRDPTPSIHSIVGVVLVQWHGRTRRAILSF